MFSFGISDEQRLARRLRNGDAGAMQEFYALHSTYLAGVCARYITDEEDRKDVFQDALVNIITHISDFHYQGDGSLKAWAKRIVVNQALMHLKAVHNHELLPLDREVVDEAEDPPVSDIPPEELHRMISELPPGYRTIFNLYVFEGWSHKEIAQLLGISEGTSSSQLHRAKNMLAKMIRMYHQLK